jgi:hypothetical protein
MRNAALLIMFALAACAGRRQTTPVGTAAPASDSPSRECQLYRAALVRLYPDSAGPRLVLLDSTFDAVFQSALNAWAGVRRGAPLTPEDHQAMRASNVARVPVPTCVRAPRPTAVVSTDHLRQLFMGRERASGWDRFYAEFPNAAGFLALSWPTVSPDGQTALVYVGRHSGWLNGEGTVVRLRRGADGWVAEAVTIVWVS